METLYVQGAYGRRYDDESAAKRDWNEGRDFQICASTTYLSMRDAHKLREDGYVRVLIALQVPAYSDAPKWAEIELNAATTEEKRT